jgi:hypothetical protein
MSDAVLASRFDLPFYLRLPSSVFLTWDPEEIAAGLLPRQRLGQVSFSKTTALVQEARLLDAPCQAPYQPPAHKVMMTCVTKDYGELPTLHIDTSQAGGFSELRPYSEVTVFATMATQADGQKGKQKARVIEILNHFLSLYRLVTQDPSVTPIDPELDLYLIDDAVGTIPEHLRNAPADNVLMQLNSIHFAVDIGDRRQYSYRLNTLDDLFPGRVLDRPFLDTFAGALREPYELPLHYDLILSSQVQLKRRNYHVAVLEAETAFEVYVEDLLLRLKVNLGEDCSQVLVDMENPKRLGLLAQRLRGLDEVATAYCSRKGLPPWVPFVGSTVHATWRDALYKLRNRVVHGGYRQATFEEAKAAIMSGKAAIKFLEDSLTDFANRIQICAGGDHLQNTAGRLRF